MYLDSMNLPSLQKKKKKKKYPETGGYLVMGCREGRACQEGCETGAQGEKKSKVGSKHVNRKLNLIDIRALEM